MNSSAAEGIEHNRQALKRVLAGLFALAGYVLGETPPPTLHRAIRTAILSLLRPAESAVRRLVVAVARDITVTLPPQRPERKPKPTQDYYEIPAGAFAIDGRQTGIVLPPNTPSRMGPNGLVYLFPRGMPPPPPPPQKRGPRRRLATDFGLFDPQFQLSRYMRPRRRRGTSVPRIWSLGYEVYRPPVRPFPRRDDPMDASPVTHRLALLARALDDLPAQAQRLATWQARRERRQAYYDALGKAAPPGRISPLRPGRMPGGRLKRFDPFARRRNNIREIDEILAHCNAIAHDIPRRDSS